jgi:hypothetical protein
VSGNKSLVIPLLLVASCTSKPSGLVSPMACRTSLESYCCANADSLCWNWQTESSNCNDYIYGDQIMPACGGFVAVRQLDAESARILVYDANTFELVAGLTERAELSCDFGPASLPLSTDCQSEWINGARQLGCRSTDAPDASFASLVVSCTADAAADQ